LVVLFKDRFHDLTYGLGSGNEIVRARGWLEARLGIGGDVKKILDDPTKPIRKPACEVEKTFDKLLVATKIARSELGSGGL
jgi:hypothetical protein